jgi:hypothetical protein
MKNTELAYLLLIIAVSVFFYRGTGLQAADNTVEEKLPRCFEILEVDENGMPVLVLDLTTGKVYEIKEGKIVELPQAPKV